MANESTIWNYLKSQGLNNYGIAGLMGNLYAESGLNPKNLQNTYEKKLGYTDDSYTAAVDNGVYSNFVKDAAGYGLAQWTYYTRKQNLLNYAKTKGTSIGDLTTQLEFLMKELSSNYSSVLHTLKTATSVLEASNAVLLKFECPANQGTSVQTARANYGQKYYNQFVKSEGVETNMGHNTYTKGKKTQLSTHFVSTEFDCHGSGCCSTTILDPQLITYLEKIREHFGKPITISSGYRCTTHNASVGGATGSRHSKGDAADIVVSGVAPVEVAKYAESIGILGIGLYETNSDGHFVHIDTRTYKSFWYGQACAARTTFGGSSSSSTTTSASKSYYGLNDSGNEVKEIQEMLNQLGYDCGAADGIYGARTKLAVVKFQKAQGLSTDGLAGEATIAALKAAAGGTSSKKVEVTANVLNVRQGPGTNYAVVGAVRKGEKITLTEISNNWGKYSKGWISLEYVKEV